MANLTYKQAIQVAPASTTTKGTLLSAAEVDGNLKSLNDDIQTRLSKAGGTLTGAFNEAPTAVLASAATTDIASAASNSVSVTGVVTITALGTIASGAVRTVTFADILILTHNATSLILPYAVDITTAAGDTAVFLSLGSGNWRMTSYSRDLELTTGSTSQYFRGDKTLRDFFTDVRAATLTGLSLITSTAVSSVDTVLVALGKLQAQISLKQDTLVSGTTLKTLDGVSLLGSGNISTASTATVTTPSNGTRLSVDTRYILDGSTTSGFVYLLPATTVGKTIKFVDLTGNWDTGPWYVGYDVTGGKVMGLTENMLVNRANFNFELVYTGTSGGWRIV